MDALGEIRSILVPTDFSVEAGQALQAAIQMARLFHASIEVFHVEIDATVVLPPPADILTVPLMTARVIAGAAERLEQAAAEVRAAGVQCTAASESGRTHAAICEHAKRSGAGMIVMATHRRHGLKHVILGSVVGKVVDHAPCPVLVVPGSAAGGSPASPGATGP